MRSKDGGDLKPLLRSSSHAEPDNDSDGNGNNNWTGDDEGNCNGNGDGHSNGNGDRGGNGAGDAPAMATAMAPEMVTTMVPVLVTAMTMVMVTGMAITMVMAIGIGMANGIANNMLANAKRSRISRLYGEGGFVNGQDEPSRRPSRDEITYSTASESWAVYLRHKLSLVARASAEQRNGRGCEPPTMTTMGGWIVRSQASRAEYDPRPAQLVDELRDK
jgi:hypothetical protein